MRLVNKTLNCRRAKVLAMMTISSSSRNRWLCQEENIVYVCLFPPRRPRASIDLLSVNADDEQTNTFLSFLKTRAMAPPRLIAKGPFYPMTPISANGESTTMHPSAQQLKSSSINRHADMFLTLIEEQRQMAVLQAHKELESCKATLANFQFNAGQVTNAYKMKVEEAMRDAQKQREEVSALSRLLDYAHLQERQLVDENDALKAKMGSATSVVTAYLDEQARLARSVSTSNSSSPGREGQLVPKSEDGYGVAGGASAATHGIDQFAQTEPVPGSSSPVSSTSGRASEEEERLRILCKRLDSENQTTTFGKIMGEVAHKKEVDSLKHSLDDLQRKYELLSKSTSRESSSGECSLSSFYYY